MEKRRKTILIFLLLVIAITPAVSALDIFSLDYKTASEQIIKAVQDIFGPFFQVILGINVINEYFFARVLILILLYAIIITAVKRIDFFSRNKFVCILVSLIVALLGARYLSETSLIELILIPYGGLAIAITTFLPFFIYFFFIHTSVSSSIGRRFAWILFAAVFFGLWISKWKTGAIGDKFNWIYMVAIAVVVLSFMFDKEIKKYFNLHEISVWKSKRKDAEISSLQEEYQRLGGVDTPQANRRKEEISRRLERLGASPA